MKGNVILLSCEPMGRFEEVIVNDTSSPGTFMEIVPSVGPIGGRSTYRHVSRVDGAVGGVAILLEDDLQGGGPTQAYTAGRRGKIYWPTKGEEMNALLRYQPGTGTASAENIGDPLEIDGATGMLQAVGTGGPTGAHVTAPFILKEHGGVAMTTNTLVWVQYQ